MTNTRFAILLFPALLAPGLLAQDTVAPTTGEPVGSARGTNKGDYNIVQSWEAGYRFMSVGGDRGKYSGDVNYRDGFRLLSSQMTVNSKDGKGKYFDEIILSTQGLGNDPYESAVLRVAKNGLYRYDLSWRQNDYFNTALVVSAGQHAQNTVHRWEDHEVTLFPEKNFRIRAGYGGVSLDGPALSSQQEFDTKGDVYPVFRNIRERFDEYRIAADGRFKNFKFTVQRRWEFYKEDTKDNQILALKGTAPALLTSFVRPQPYRGRTPGWMGNIYGETRWIALNAHASYSSGTGDYAQNELAIGLDRFGSSANRQIAVRAHGNRPVAAGDFATTVLPGKRFSIVNNLSASNTRMNGSNLFQQYDASTLSFATVNFQFLGIRLVTNSTDAHFRISKRLDVFGGVRFSQREIRSIEDTADAGSKFDGVSGQQTNSTKAGVFGANVFLGKAFRAHFEGEIGRNDNPLTPVSLRDYHAIRSKLQYRTKTWTLGGGYNDNYNTNSVQITAYSAHSRTYSANGSWTAKSWVSVDAGYSKLHLDTIGGIVFFAGSPRAVRVTDQQSMYVSNIHAANIGLRFALRKYADLVVGYNLTKDTGDGRAMLTAQSSANAQILYNAQTFPLTYQTPLLRLSVRLTEKLRWNVGYQYYGYHEDFGLLSLNQGYRANTGYTSLLWAF